MQIYLLHSVLENVYSLFFVELLQVSVCISSAKIRRLYDIANILTSLDLIKKVHVTEIRGRKPAFKYIGPEIDNTADINSKYNLAN